MFYVYEWFVKSTEEVIYVGKGSKGRYKVLKHNRLFNEMIKRFECESRIVKTFESESDAFAFEYTHIKELREIGQCVCNISDGGYGGVMSWWNDDLRKKYSENNVMKSEKQRKRMSEKNPMKDPAIAEKVNGQKRRPVTIGDVTYKSMTEAQAAYGINQYMLNKWCKDGVNPDGLTCRFEREQVQRWHRTIHGNQHPSRRNTDNSTPEGSTTNR